MNAWVTTLDDLKVGCSQSELMLAIENTSSHHLLASYGAYNRLLTHSDRDVSRESTRSTQNRELIETLKKDVDFYRTRKTLVENELSKRLKSHDYLMRLETPITET